MTDDEIEALAKKHLAPHADRLDAIMKNPVPYQQTEQFRRVKALIADVLSKLRAPVADASIKQALKLVDELRKSAFAKGVCPDSGVCHHNCVSQCARQHELGCVPLGVSGLGDDWKLDIERGASAPVAGEAQKPLAVTDLQGDVHWKHGRKPGIALYAAPQASEAVRDAALEEAIEAVSRIPTSYATFASGNPQYRPESRPASAAIADAIETLRALKSQRAALSAQPGAQKKEQSDA